MQSLFSWLTIACLFKFFDANVDAKIDANVSFWHQFPLSKYTIYSILLEQNNEMLWKICPHNPKVGSSNLPPATTKRETHHPVCLFFLPLWVSDAGLGKCAGIFTGFALVQPAISTHSAQNQSSNLPPATKMKTQEFRWNSCVFCFLGPDANQPKNSFDAGFDAKSDADNLTTDCSKTPATVSFV